MTRLFGPRNPRDVPALPDSIRDGIAAAREADRLKAKYEPPVEVKPLVMRTPEPILEEVAEPTLPEFCPLCHRTRVGCDCDD